MRFKLRRYYLYYLGRILAFLVSLVPLSAGIYIGSGLGYLAYFVLGKYRRVTMDNLKSALGNGMNERELKAIAKGVFENLGRNAVELVNFPKINSSNIDRYVRIVNRDTLDNELKKGRGIIVITGHFGDWELLALSLIIKGYKGAVIGRRIYFDRYDRYLNSLRREDVIYRDESPKRVLRALKENGIIGILADQDVDSVDGVFVNFFGRPAYTPAGPVALAKASGASMVPAFMVREGSRHALFVEKPVSIPDSGDRQKDILDGTQKWSDVVEAYIRRYPDHWVWMHKRWKTKR